jgi:hypothetical protein
VPGTRLLAFELQLALVGGRRHDLIRHTIATLVARQIEQYIATRPIGYLILEASAYTVASALWGRLYWSASPLRKVAC